MTRSRTALLSVVALALGACAPREAPTTSPSTDDASPPAVRTEFLSETDDDSIADSPAPKDDAPPAARPDAPKADAPKTDTKAPPEQESTAPSPDGTQPEAGAPPPSPTHG